MPTPSHKSQSIDAEKKRIRQKTLRSRDALSPEMRIEQSLSAADCSRTVPEFTSEILEPGTIISGFLPIRSEIDPRPLMASLSRLGARLCLPVVVDVNTIEFRELTKNGDLVDSGFGTVGPSNAATVLEPQILLIPLSAFDRVGGRIGYGGGYYDRAILKLRDIFPGTPFPLLCGLGFSVQEIESVPMDHHDQYLDYVITDENVIDCRSLRK